MFVLLLALHFTVLSIGTPVGVVIDPTDVKIYCPAGPC